MLDENFNKTEETPPILCHYEISEEEKERRRVKRYSYTVGTAFIVMSFLVTVLNDGVIYIMRFLGLSDFKISEIVNEPAIEQLLQILFTVTLFTVPFIIVFKIFGYRISDIVSLKPCKKGLLLLGLGLCSFANIASSYLGEFVDSFGVNYEVDFGTVPKGVFGFALAFISTVITPALFEEFTCRGIVLGAGRKISPAFAVVTSATFFGLMHANFEQIPFALFIGLVLGFVTLKSGSMWTAVLIHGINNFVSLAFSTFLGKLSSNVQIVVYSAYLVLSLIGIIIAMALLKDKEGIFSLDTEKTALPLKQKFKIFFLNPTVIIYAVICIIKSFKYFV